MPLTTSERATLVAAIEAIPVSDVDVPALQAALAAAEATIATQASTIEALTFGANQLEQKIVNGRAAIELARLAVVASSEVLA